MTSATAGSTGEVPASEAAPPFSLATPPALPSLASRAALTAKSPPRAAAAAGLSLGGKLWQWPTWQAAAADLAPPAEAAAGRAPPRWLGRLLAQRGIEDVADQAQFLAPSLRQLSDPAGIKEMDRAVARILQAKARHESVCVYGDYDVDGVSASSIVSEYFAVLGLTCEVYLPDRRHEGYGLNAAAVTQLAARHQLMVTVDCGSTSVVEIAAGRALGLDAVIIDHHQVGETRPDAVALLNPHQPGCTFADKDLCATGVAFMLVVALRRALRATDPAHPAAQYDVRQLLDLVAVATVADMVPLVGQNRLLVHAGLHRLNTQPRPGLKALMDVARVADARCTSADLGFRLGPRINARGRLDHAGLGVTLMRADSQAAAAPLAQVLDEANQDRRHIERACVDEAIRTVQQESLAAHAAIVVANPAWHPGVLGLVASRLVQRYHRPAVVIGEGGKGSARSIDGLNLHACLSLCNEHMLRFGGHPAAAGLTMALDQVVPLRLALASAVARELGPPPYAPLLRPDVEVDFAALTLKTVETLARLEPFGRANPEVLFALRNQAVQAQGRVGDGHLKLRLSPSAERGAGCVEAIAFGMGDLYGRLPERIDVLFHLERNEFRGLAQVQMRVVDVRGAVHPVGSSRA